MARAYIDRGEFPKARQALERTPGEERRNYRLRQQWALLLALEGKRAEALKEMDAGLQAYARVVQSAALQAVEFYALMGDTAKALEWLDRAVRMGDDREDWFRRDPLLASIRDQPRFQQMLASVATGASSGPGTVPRFTDIVANRFRHVAKIIASRSAVGNRGMHIIETPRHPGPARPWQQRPASSSGRPQFPE